MPEYIEKEAAINVIAKLCPDGKMYEHQNGYTVLIDTYDAIDGINDIPAADVAPVLHGRWIIPTIIDGRPFHIYHCSFCKGVPCGVDENTKYCPNCGAKMDLEVHHE